MKNSELDRKEQPAMKTANFVAILAIVTEMARCVNENISKVDLKPIGHAAGEASKV